MSLSFKNKPTVEQERQLIRLLFECYTAIPKEFKTNIKNTELKGSLSFRIEYSKNKTVEKIKTTFQYYITDLLNLPLHMTELNKEEKKFIQEYWVELNKRVIDTLVKEIKKRNNEDDYEYLAVLQKLTELNS